MYLGAVNTFSSIGLDDISFALAPSPPPSPPTQYVGLNRQLDDATHDVVIANAVLTNVQTGEADRTKALKRLRSAQTALAQIENDLLKLSTDSTINRTWASATLQQVRYVKQLAAVGQRGNQTLQETVQAYGATQEPGTSAMAKINLQVKWADMEVYRTEAAMMGASLQGKPSSEIARLQEEYTAALDQAVLAHAGQRLQEAQARAPESTETSSAKRAFTLALLTLDAHTKRRSLSSSETALAEADAAWARATPPEVNAKKAAFNAAFLQTEQDNGLRTQADARLQLFQERGVMGDEDAAANLTAARQTWTTAQTAHAVTNKATDRQFGDGWLDYDGFFAIPSVDEKGVQRRADGSYLVNYYDPVLGMIKDATVARQNGYWVMTVTTGQYSDDSGNVIPDPPIVLAPDAQAVWDAYDTRAIVTQTMKPIQHAFAELPDPQVLNVETWLQRAPRIQQEKTDADAAVMMALHDQGDLADAYVRQDRAHADFEALQALQEYIDAERLVFQGKNSPDTMQQKLVAAEKAINQIVERSEDVSHPRDTADAIDLALGLRTLEDPPSVLSSSWQQARTHLRESGERAEKALAQTTLQLADAQTAYDKITSGGSAQIQALEQLNAARTRHDVLSKAVSAYSTELAWLDARRGMILTSHSGHAIMAQAASIEMYKHGPDPLRLTDLERTISNDTRLNYLQADIEDGRHQLMVAQQVLDTATRARDAAFTALTQTSKNLFALSEAQTRRPTLDHDLVDEKDSDKRAVLEKEKTYVSAMLAWGEAYDQSLIATVDSDQLKTLQSQADAARADWQQAGANVTVDIAQHAYDKALTDYDAFARANSALANAPGNPTVEPLRNAAAQLDAAKRKQLMASLTQDQTTFDVFVKTHLPPGQRLEDFPDTPDGREAQIEAYRKLYQLDPITMTQGYFDQTAASLGTVPASIINDIQLGNIVAAATNYGFRPGIDVSGLSASAAAYTLTHSDIYFNLAAYYHPLELSGDSVINRLKIRDNVVAQILKQGGPNPELRVIPIAFEGAYSAIFEVRNPSTGKLVYVGADQRVYQDFNDFQRHNQVVPPGVQMVMPKDNLFSMKDGHLALQVIAGRTETQVEHFTRVSHLDTIIAISGLLLSWVPVAGAPIALLSLAYFAAHQLDQMEDKTSHGQNLTMQDWIHLGILVAGMPVTGLGIINSLMRLNTKLINAQRALDAAIELGNPTAIATAQRNLASLKEYSEHLADIFHIRPMTYLNRTAIVGGIYTSYESLKQLLNNWEHLSNTERWELSTNILVGMLSIVPSLQHAAQENLHQLWQQWRGIKENNYARGDDGEFHFVRDANGRLVDDNGHLVGPRPTDEFFTLRAEDANGQSRELFSVRSLDGRWLIEGEDGHWYTRGKLIQGNDGEWYFFDDDGWLVEVAEQNGQGRWGRRWVNAERGPVSINPTPKEPPSAPHADLVMQYNPATDKWITELTRRETASNQRLQRPQDVDYVRPTHSSVKLRTPSIEGSVVNELPVDPTAPINRPQRFARTAAPAIHTEPMHARIDTADAHLPTLRTGTPLTPNIAYVPLPPINLVYTAAVVLRQFQSLFGELRESAQALQRTQEELQIAERNAERADDARRQIDTRAHRRRDTSAARDDRRRLHEREQTVAHAHQRAADAYEAMSETLQRYHAQQQLLMTLTSSPPEAFEPLRQLELREAYVETQRQLHRDIVEAYAQRDQTRRQYRNASQRLQRLKRDGRAGDDIVERDVAETRARMFDADERLSDLRQEWSNERTFSQEENPNRTVVENRDDPPPDDIGVGRQLPTSPRPFDSGTRMSAGAGRMRYDTDTLLHDPIEEEESIEIPARSGRRLATPASPRRNHGRIMQRIHNPSRLVVSPAQVVKSPQANMDRKGKPYEEPTSGFDPSATRGVEDRVFYSNSAGSEPVSRHPTGGQGGGKPPYGNDESPSDGGDGARDEEPQDDESNVVPPEVTADAKQLLANMALDTAPARLTPVPAPWVKKLQRLTYDHPFPHRLKPTKPQSLLDNINLRVRAWLPNLPGYHAAQVVLWGRIHCLLERAPHLHPDNREWAIESLQRSEGVVFDFDKPAVETRIARLNRLQFYERDPADPTGRQLVSADSFGPEQFDENTVVVFVGNTANNPSQLSKYSRILDEEVFQHIPKNVRVVYLQEPLEYFTYALVEAQKLNRDIERYAPERAKYIAWQLFGRKISRDGINVDADGRVTGEKLPPAILKRNMRTNTLAISWGGTIYTGVINEVRRCMQALGYTADEIRDAMRQSFCLMVAPVVKMTPRDAFSTTISLLSENDLLVRSRVATNRLFRTNKRSAYPRRIDIDANQIVMLTSIPKIVTVEADDGKQIPWLRDRKGDPIYSMNGHEYAIYLRDLLVEFRDQHPEHVLVNTIGAGSLGDTEALFAKPILPKSKPMTLEIARSVTAKALASVPEHVDDGEAAMLVNKTLSVGDRIASAMRRLGRYVPGEYEELCQEASRFLEYLDKHASHINFASILRTRAHDPRTRDRTFITMTNRPHPEGAESYTYAQADQEANRIRYVFRSFGLSEGSRIAIRGLAPEHLFAREAALAEGCIVSPLCITYGDKGLVERLAFIDVDAVVTTAELLEQTMRIRSQITGRFAKPFKIFVIERDVHGNKLAFGAKQELLDTITDGNHPDVYPLTTLAERSPDVELPIRRVRKGQIALSMMTSGSSGVLKESLIPHSYGLGSYITSNVWWGVHGAATARKYNGKLEYLAPRGKEDDEVDRVFCTAPLGWMYPFRGLGVVAIAGAEFVFAKFPSAEKQDDALTIGTLEHARITVLAGVPPLYRRFNKYLVRNGVKLPFLRHAISTAEVLGERTIEDFYRATTLPIELEGVATFEGVEIRNGYAATEEGPMFVHPAGMNLPRGALGVAVPGIDFELIDEEGRPVMLAPGNGGALLIRKTPISSEYRFATAKDAQAYQSDLHTDLRGRYRDTHDAIVFQDDLIVNNITRTDDLIKRGVQIYPHEIQDKFTTSFPDNVINCTVGIKFSKDENVVVVEYLELPITVDAMGDDPLRDSVQATIELIDRTKRPDFVIVGQGGTPRNQNKTQVRVIRNTMEVIVQKLRANGITRGIFVVPILDQPIESMNVTQLGELNLQ